MKFVRIFQFINTQEGGMSITERTKDAIGLHVNPRTYELTGEDFIMHSYTVLNCNVLNLAEGKEYGIEFDEEYPENDSYFIIASCEEEAMKIFWNYFLAR